MSELDADDVNHEKLKFGWSVCGVVMIAVLGIGQMSAAEYAG